jgi:hypothetical protein
MSLDDDLDRLYQLPPSEFIAERNALAKRAGDRGQEIRALPKPTLPVWAVNQLHWREPAVYKALVESSENLRATHRAVLEGRKGDVRAAGREHETALDAAIKAALAIAGEDGTPPSDAARQTIATTLRSLPAADSPGRLRQALTPGGFEMLSAFPGGGRVVPARMTPTPAKPAPKPGKGGPQPKRKIDKAALLRAQKAAAAAERELSKAEQEARREEFEAARAAREMEKAQRRVTRAKEAVETAQAELDDAEEASAAALKQRDATRARAAAADRTLGTARARHDAAQRDLRAAEAG